MGIGQSSDEVHRYGGEREGMFDGQRRKSGYSGVCVHLGHLTISTSQDEFVEKGGHSWPPIVPVHSVKHSEEPFMSSSRGVVERFY